MKKCKDCLWHYTCSCDKCKESQKVVCSVKNEHVSENDSCERFVEEDK